MARFYYGTAEVYDNYAPTIPYATPVSCWANSAVEFREKVKKEMEEIGCGIVQVAIRGTKLERKIIERDIQRASNHPGLYT